MSRSTSPRGAHAVGARPAARVGVRLATLALLATAAACGERGGPTGTTDGVLEGRRAASPGITASDQRQQLEDLARTVALSLSDPAIRSRLKRQLDGSQVREHKIQFQRYLSAEGGAPATEMAQASGAGLSALEAGARSAIPLELYLPVPEHRTRWTGGENVLVATELNDHEAPVAFDTKGHRRVLSPDTPPATPVLALVPQETNFDAPASSGVTTDATCVEPYSGGFGTVTGSSCDISGSDPGVPSPGLWMTGASFTGTFEGWLKGSPEFEVHILGQAGTTDSLKDYQCAGEHQPTPYYFDQNATSWTGRVLLFSQTQINSYKQAHQGNSMRVVVIEDDDTACQIKLDAGRFATFLRVLDSAYRQLTAGRDTTTALQHFWNQAKAVQNIFQSLWSVITTQDDLVGEAVRDAVAGEFRPGANWIVKGENNITTGALNLKMY
ncbi:MAG TPA: hypothetical protein VFW66_08630 [Gemmatimonadales bacterium]|nr:hypothetical protein [Gemmatimonadales bacterium]